MSPAFGSGGNRPKSNPQPYYVLIISEVWVGEESIEGGYSAAAAGVVVVLTSGEVSWRQGRR